MTSQGSTFTSQHLYMFGNVSHILAHQFRVCVCRQSLLKVFELFEMNQRDSVSEKKDESLYNRLGLFMCQYFRAWKAERDHIQ